VPVLLERVIPGYWYTVASSKCSMELYDSNRLDGKYIAAVNVAGDDTGKESEKHVAERLMKKTIEEAVAAIFLLKNELSHVNLSTY
jgi:hypothetical protein